MQKNDTQNIVCKIVNNKILLLLNLFLFKEQLCWNLADAKILLWTRILTSAEFFKKTTQCSTVTYSDQINQILEDFDC